MSYLADAIRKQAADIDDSWSREDPRKDMTDEQLALTTAGLTNREGKTGKQELQFDSDLPMSSNRLLKALVKRRYKTGWDAKVDGTEASLNQVRGRMMTNIVSGTPHMKGISGRESGARGYAPTKLGWGATAAGGAAVGGGLGAGIAGLLGKDKLTGGLIGAGLGGIGAPLALLAYGKARGDMYGDTQSYDKPIE